MGQNLSLIADQMQTNNKTTLECFESTNWTCPEKLKLCLYEISICSSVDFRRRSNAIKIKEFFLPEYNIGINNQSDNYNSNKYHVLLNAQDRYKEKDGSKVFMDNYEPPKLINTFTLTKESNQSELEEIFDLIKTSVKAKNMDRIVEKLFELTK